MPNTPSGVSRRSLPFLWSGSGPWHAKHLFARIGRVSRVKSSFAIEEGVSSAPLLGITAIEVAARATPTAAQRRSSRPSAVSGTSILQLLGFATAAFGASRNQALESLCLRSASEVALRY